MIKIENTEVVGVEHAIRGMRNPKNSWERSDSYEACIHGPCETCRKTPEYPSNCEYFGSAEYVIGENDHKLMMQLANGGPVHAKYRRMIVVYVDITAPLYWWKEFDTYKVGTVANSCSTMHKIHDKEFTLDDFSCEHLISTCLLEEIINELNISLAKYKYKMTQKYMISNMKSALLSQTKMSTMYFNAWAEMLGLKVTMIIESTDTAEDKLSEPYVYLSERDSIFKLSELDPDFKFPDLPDRETE